MSSPDLATPSEEWTEWSIAPVSSQRPAERVEVVDYSRGSPDSGAHALVLERVPPSLAPMRKISPAGPARQLGECIGRGQFGFVFRALSLDDGKVVAIKRIALEGRTKDEISQLSNEVTFLQKLSHPAVVKYEGVVRTENYLNIILEFVENGSLQQTLKQFGQLPEGLVAGYVAKILEGLAYLHAQGVVHCDLKAANVLSTKNGNIKLSDFGVSLQIHAIKTTRGLAAAVNDINGTPNWMAPEVISMAGSTTASDIWSLAATICELISGHPPYHDLVAMSAMFRIVEDEMPPLPEFASPELQDFLKKCFNKLPQQRPTAAALFTHPWLLRNARDVSHDLRPQDSLPLFRRYTVDTPHPAVHASEGAANAFPTTRQPTAVESSPRIDTPLHNVLSEASSPAAPPSQTALASSKRRHDFVKITSSREPPLAAVEPPVV
ncbi:kinase-like protein [Rhodotorula sp. JG-1b]|nr:kinase-like protein [Rhodotorula sp. JG-1b]